MKKKLLYFAPMLFSLIVINSCEESSKEPVSSIQETPPSRQQASVFSSPREEKNEISEYPGKERSMVSETPAKNTIESEIMEEAKNPSGKKIPFQELLRANIAFTENKGQLERFENFYFPELKNVKFYSKAFCGTAYFAHNGIGFGFQRTAFRDVDFNVNNTPKEKLTKAERKAVTGFSIEFLGCNEQAFIKGLEEQHTKTNYLKGNNPAAYITDISSYEKVRYSQLYKGIDLLYYNKNNQLKYDYILAPKADVNQIRMSYNNVNELAINKKGELEILIDWGMLYDKKPYSYQMIKGKKKEVEVVYKKINNKTIGFEIKGKYDPTKELVIDPFTVAWATYIGTATSDDGYIESTVIDASGRVLGTGWTNNAFPISASANGYDKTYNNGTDAYVFRLNTAGTAMDYITYLGGGGNETGTGIAVNSAGDICVSGFTGSFAQTTFRENSTTTLTVATGNVTVNVANIGVYGNPQNIMLVNGTNVLYGTIYGFANATTLNVNITAVTGAGTYGTWAVSIINQMPFPSTAGSIQPAKTGLDGNDDIFYLKLNGSGNNLIYGTHYGGTSSLPDWAIDMVLDNSDNAYITGRTQTTTGFSTSGVYKTAPQGGYDAFVLKINSAGTLGYCTYVGGAANDIGKGVAVTSTGQLYVTGMTGSSGQGSGGVYQNTIAGGDDAFLAKLSSTGTLMFFTYLGGTAMDCGAGIDLVSPNDEPVIVGTTASSNFPRVNAIDNTYGAEEGFIARFNAYGTALRYSSFIGGDGSDNTKGFDYTTVHKNGGIKIVAGKPVIVIAASSSPGSLSPFMVSPVSYTAVNQSGVTFTHNGGSYSGGALGDFFITVLDSTGQTGLFGSYFGGTDNDYPTAGINVLQSSACVIFGGGVHSLPFPVTPGVFQTQRVNTTTPDQAAIVKVCLPEILPVELLKFDVKEQDGHALLNWSTLTETNNSYFEVLKSTDGIHFYPVGKVQGNGTSSMVSYYSFNDPELLTGISYYRLKQVDFDGQFKFTDIRMLNVEAFTDLRVLSNPGNGLIQLQNYFRGEVAIEISVHNVLNQEIYTSKEKAQKGLYEKEINLQQYAPGLYIVQVKAGNEVKVIRYIKQ